MNSLPNEILDMIIDYIPNEEKDMLFLVNSIFRKSLLRTRFIFYINTKRDFVELIRKKNYLSLSNLKLDDNKKIYVLNVANRTRDKKLSKTISPISNKTKPFSHLII